jgi:hypothetical protein
VDVDHVGMENNKDKIPTAILRRRVAFTDNSAISVTPCSVE